MADTPLAMENLVKRFGGHVCSMLITIRGETPEFYSQFILENELASTTKKKSKAAVYQMYYSHTAYDAPTVIICSVAEMKAATPSAELQAYRNMGVSTHSSRFDFSSNRDLYFSILRSTERIISMIPLSKVQQSRKKIMNIVKCTYHSSYFYLRMYLYLSTL